jgi:hypothetical protein
MPTIFFTFLYIFKKNIGKHIIQLLHLNEINMRFYGAILNEANAEFNIVVLCSIKPHIDQVQV